MATLPVSVPSIQIQWVKMIELSLYWELIVWMYMNFIYWFGLHFLSTCLKWKCVFWFYFKLRRKFKYVCCMNLWNFTYHFFLFYVVWFSSKNFYVHCLKYSDWFFFKLNLCTCMNTFAESKKIFLLISDNIRQLVNIFHKRTYTSNISITSRFVFT